MPGVIDEFLIKAKVVSDDTDLKKLLKNFKKYNDQVNRQNEEEAGKEKGLWAKYYRWRQDIDAKDPQKKAGRKQFKEDVSKINAGIKQGVSVARGWAVALLSVDGAAMAVVGRLSQMAVEYDNTAGSINMAASEMKAWEDTLKGAGADIGDIQSSFQSLYENSVKMATGEADSGFISAMGRLGVRATTETGEARDPGEVFGEIITGLRSAIESGRMNEMQALRTLGQTGVSTKLFEPLMAQQPEGGYRVNEEEYQKYLKRAEGMDDLADASREVSEAMTNLSSIVRSKMVDVINRLVSGGELQKMMDRVADFIEEIDAEKVADVIEKLIGALEKVVGWVNSWLPDVIEAAPEVARNIAHPVESLMNPSDRMQAASQAVQRESALKSALREELGFLKFGGLMMELQGKETEGGRSVTETELAKKAYELGLSPQQIFQKANIPNVNNEIQVLIDGKFIPYRVQERQYIPAGGLASAEEG